MEEKFLKLTNSVYKVLEFLPESDPLKNRAKEKALVIMENLILLSSNDGWASFQTEKIKVNLLEDIDTLLGYLWIGKSQGWLNSVNCLIFSNEYEKIKKEIEPKIELTKKLSKIEVPVISTVDEQQPEPADAPELVEGDTVVEDAVAEEYDKQAIDEVDIDEIDIHNKQNQPIGEITERQKKIIEFLEKNEKAQVMDLQTVLPDITKRTIRRDLDELLDSGKIVRMGDFNQVSYQLKR